MTDFESLILLMSIAALLVSLAQKAHISYPIALVTGGCLLSFIPGVDYTYFDPNLILTIVLPPILYHAAFWTSLRDFKKSFGEICSLALGLVLVTTLIIGIFFKWCFPEFSWALAFTFGAIVSPPDAAAATTILKQFPLRKKLITILEGESLVNDASALVLYKIAVTAILTGTFSLLDATADFVFTSTGGILLGVCVGYTLQLFSRRYLDPVVGTFSSFLIPYITYILSSVVGVSGVLAVVASGVVGSRMVFKHNSPLRRMLGHVTWDMYIILLNCFIFILIGSQLDKQTEYMNWNQVLTYTCYAFLVTILMCLIRLIWVAITAAITYFRFRGNPARAISISQLSQDGTILSWASMRGIVSLTAALAIPITLNNGLPVEGRSELIYMTFCVILFTLLLPGLTLSKLISWLNIPPVPISDNPLETWRDLAKVASDEISRLRSDNSVSDEESSFLNNYFNSRFQLMEHSSLTDTQHKNLESARKMVLQAQRKMLVQIWEHGHIDDRVLAEIERVLDAEETHAARAEI